MKLSAFSALLSIALSLSATTVVATESVKNIRGSQDDAAEATKFEHALVVPDVLSKEAIEWTKRSMRLVGNGDNDGKNRHFGEALVQADDVHKIFRAIGDDRTVSLPAVSFRTALVTGNTVAHTDGVSNTEPEKQVLVMFMNTVEGAYFEVEDEQIPVVAGSLVSFKGNTLSHRTVVPEGEEVHLLGPISVQDIYSVDNIMAQQQHLFDATTNKVNTDLSPISRELQGQGQGPCCGIDNAILNACDGGCEGPSENSNGCKSLCDAFDIFDCTTTTTTTTTTPGYTTTTTGYDRRSVLI